MSEVGSAPSAANAEDGAPFNEKLTEWIVLDGLAFALLPFGVGALLLALGAKLLAALAFGVALFVVAFFRNPERAIPGDADAVVSPADGRVIEAGPVELPDGTKAVRVAIFLSVFNVHVNRMPVSGRVVSIERAGNAYLAAFNPDALTHNVRLDVVLAMANGARVVVSQITGLIARRIVCHAHVGDAIARGQRYGLIRFGSRTDVVLPASALPCVARGDRVRGGASVIARLEGASGAGGRSA